MVNITAYPIYPIPQERPIAKVNNTYDISFGSPGTLLNLIIENAPAKLKALATLFPTSKMIIEIINGSIINVVAKPEL